MFREEKAELNAFLSVSKLKKRYYSEFFFANTKEIKKWDRNYRDDIWMNHNNKKPYIIAS